MRGYHGRAAGAVVLALVSAVSPVPARAEAADETALRQARAYALKQLARTDRQLAEGRFPTVAPESSWHTSGVGGWLGGFYPGRLWLAYALSGRSAWRERAADRQGPLRVRADDRDIHDLGFLLETSFGRGARLAGRESDARVVRTAAGSLAGRYVPTVRAIRSWAGPPGQVTVIVDSLMNLELLFHAADLADRPAWRRLAARHALTVARTHVRPDGSTWHVVRFAERTGAVVWKGTRQGRADQSTWARGHSWAVHGFTTAYRETGERRLLAAARRTADWAIAHLPADGVPVWDYDDPGGVRDTTAGAALASGLLELARIDPDPQRRAAYRRAGMRTLRSLTGPTYLSRGSGSPAILLHGRHDARYADAGVTYGDYYLLEALERVQLLPSRVRRVVPRQVRRIGDTWRAALGRVAQVSAVSVRWRDGERRAYRFVVQTSADGAHWRTARGAVSSGRVATWETYDLADRPARFVRLRLRDGGRAHDVAAVRVRG